MKENKIISEQYKQISHAFGASSQKNNDTEISKKILEILQISRNIFITTFLPEIIKSDISFEQISDSYKKSNQTYQIFDLIRGPQYVQSISHGIGYIYQNPSEFATSLYSYFKEDKTYLNLFANLTFPTLYGFFITEELNDLAVQLLNELINLYCYDDEEFVTPFVVSFFNSCNIFSSFFWETFFSYFKKIHPCKPTHFQIFNYIMGSLENSIKYLPPFHISLSITLLFQNPSLFSICFFEKFILRTFNSWFKYYPEYHSFLNPFSIKEVINFISNDIKTKQERSLYYLKIMEFFQKPESYTCCELISFAEHNQYNKISILISPLETKYLSEILCLIPKLSKAIHTSKEFKDQKVFDNFSAGCLHIFLRNSLKRKALNIKRLLFPITEPQKVQGNEEQQRIWKKIQRICYVYNLDPFSLLIDSNNIRKNDTFWEQKVKRKIRKYFNNELVNFVTLTIKDITIKTQNNFEDFLLQTQLLDHLNELKKSLFYYYEMEQNNILNDSKFYGTLFHYNLFNKNIPKFEIVCDDAIDLLSIKDAQNSFNLALDKRTKKFNKLDNDNSIKNSILFPLSKLDEIPIGEQFHIILNVYSKIVGLFQGDNELSLGYLGHFIIKAGVKTLFFTLQTISLCFYKRNNLFEMLSNDQKHCWEEISSFLQNITSE